MFWLLGILPLLIVWGMRSARLRRLGWNALAQRGRPPGDGTIWWLTAIGCAILALTQPKWGRDRSSQLPSGHDVVLLMDVSRSMGAEDAVPDRLGVAKESARSLVEALGESPGNRIAVVAFAGRGVLRCPMTENVGAVIDAVNRLKPGDLRPGGTDLAAGLEAAIEAFDPEEHEEGRTILVFSDGEDHAGRWEQEVLHKKLHEKRVIVHAITIGDPEQGHPVPIHEPSSPPPSKNSTQAPGPGNRSLEYQGKPVLSRRVDAPLEELVRRAGGTIIRLGLASTDLGDLYKSRIEPTATRTRAEMRLAERTDRFPLFLLAAILSSLLGMRSRPGRARAGRRRSRSDGYRWTPRARAVARSTAAILFLLVIPGAEKTERAVSSGDVKDSINQGLAWYREGNYEKAKIAFESAIRQAPKSPIPRYNLAATLFQLGLHGESLVNYMEARNQADPRLRTKIDFALGNAALVSGDITSAIRHYDECLASTEPSKELDAVRQDAAINRAFALERNQAPAAEQAPGAPKDSSDQERTKDPEKQKSGQGDQSEGDGSEASSGSRRKGGSGGEGARGKMRRPDSNSPEGRLDEALEQIRDARRRRLPDDEPSHDAEAKDNDKDW